MRTNSLSRRLSSAFSAALLVVLAGSLQAQTPAELPLRDEFDGKLTLDWETVRPDPTHFSLSTYPGKLTITTQYGSLHRSQATAKNLLLVEVPEGVDDFVATTCLEDFVPGSDWQQAGLLIYDDDDNYVKFGRDYSTKGYPLIKFSWEVAQDVTGIGCPVDVNSDRYMLRITKRGNFYQCAVSEDGQAFVTWGIVEWGDGSPMKVGLVAKNGPRYGDREAKFDFFELRPLTDAERDDLTFAIRRALQGKWRAVSREVGGEAVTEGPATQLVVQPGFLALKEDKNLAMIYAIDPTETPNRITLIPRYHPLGSVLNGICSLEGDTFTLCLNSQVNGPTPDAFETAEGDGRMLLKFRRVEQEK